jgi:hypothetical protein
MRRLVRLREIEIGSDSSELFVRGAQPYLRAVVGSQVQAA